MTNGKTYTKAYHEWSLREWRTKKHIKKFPIGGKALSRCCLQEKPRGSGIKCLWVLNLYMGSLYHEENMCSVSRVIKARVRTHSDI